MDKQQAAAEFARGKEDGSTEYGARKEGFIAGWEACEAQSPSDAVAFIEWLLKNDYYISSDGSCYSLIGPKSKSKSISIADLYKLFNPSGAAPQAEGGYTEDEKELFAMQFVVFALTDPRAQGLIAAKSPVGAILDLYKDRAYIDEDTSKQ